MAPLPKQLSVFKDYWLLNPEFSEWLQPGANKYEFSCLWCKRHCSLSNMGKRALRSHAKGARHSDMQKAKQKTPITDHFQKDGAITDHVQNEGAIPVQKESGNENSSQPQSLLVPSSSSRKQASFQNFLIKDDVTDAEIIWCLASVYHHLSLSSGGSCTKYFPLMFKSSQIAEKISLGNDKMRYIIVFGLGKYFSKKLIDQLVQNAEMFSISFDESLSKFIQKEQMDFHVRFWCSAQNECITRYMGSSFLRGSTAVDLMNAFKCQLEPLDLKKLLQVSTDGPNVNLKFHKDLQDYLDQAFEPSDKFILLNIGNCGLHVLNNSFKSAFKKTNWCISDFLWAVYNLLRNTPARKADYIKYGRTSLFPLKFCGTRWLENGPVADRSILLLEPLKLYISGVSGTPRQPTSKCYEKVATFVNDPMLKPRLAFFSSIAKNFEPVLKTFQAEKPLAPFLYDDYTQLLENLMSIIVKKDIVDKKYVTSIDVKNPENLIPVTQINYGHAVREIISENRNSISNNDILQFKKDVQQCVKDIVLKIVEKSPLKYGFTKSISFCSPYLINRCLTKGKSWHEERLKDCLNKLVHVRRMGGVEADKIERDFHKLCCTPGVAGRMQAFKRKENRLDHFWVDLLNDFCENSAALLNLLKMIFILFHGQAAVERGFSINKEVIVENQQEQTFVAMRMVYASIELSGGVDKVEITKEMRLFVRNARSEYHEYLKREKEKKSKADGVVAAEKRKAEELKVLQNKKKKVLENAQIEAQIIDEEIRRL